MKKNLKGFIKFIICAAIVAGIILDGFGLLYGVFKYILYGVTSIFTMIGVCVLVDWIYNEREK